MKNKTLFISVAALCIVALAAVFICKQVGILDEIPKSSKILTTDVSDKIKNTDKQVISITGGLPMRDINTVILQSELIITGEVEEIKPSRWTDPERARGILQTDIVIKVNEVLFGDDLSSEVTVRIDKGEDESTIFVDEWTPDFTVGENVLLFLMRDSSAMATDEDYYVLSAIEQAKYLIYDNGTAVCEFENKTLDLNTLPTQIESLYVQNPNIRQQQAEERQRIRENNAELFGE